MSAESELAGFIEKFAPDMQRRITSCRAKMQARFPDAVELVYDNDNFPVIGFGPNERPSDATFSLAAYSRGVNLCFLQHRPGLPDPTSILRGSGKVLRDIVLDSADDLDRPDIHALIEAAIELAGMPMVASDGRPRADHQVDLGQETPAPLSPVPVHAGGHDRTPVGV